MPAPDGCSARRPVPPRRVDGLRPSRVRRLQTRSPANIEQVGGARRFTGPGTFSDVDVDCRLERPGRNRQLRRARARIAPDPFPEAARRTGLYGSLHDRVYREAMRKGPAQGRVRRCMADPGTVTSELLPTAGAERMVPFSSRRHLAVSLRRVDADPSVGGVAVTFREGRR